MAEGWIKLHRKLQDNPLWMSESFTRGQAWLDLLLLVNHKDGHIRINGERIEVKRSQTARSILTLSKRWKWSRGKTTRFLRELEKDAQIILKTNTRTSIITICNYDKYQSRDTTDDTTRDTTDGQLADINKNEKNKKERKELPDWLPEEDWQSYVEMRVKIKSPMTEKAKVLAIKKLERFKNAGQDIQAVLQNSVMSSYKGLFENQDKFGKPITKTVERTDLVDFRKTKEYGEL